MKAKTTRVFERVVGSFVNLGNRGSDDIVPKALKDNDVVRRAKEVPIEMIPGIQLDFCELIVVFAGVITLG